MTAQAPTTALTNMHSTDTQTGANSLSNFLHSTERKYMGLLVPHVGYWHSSNVEARGVYVTTVPIVWHLSPCNNYNTVLMEDGLAKQIKFLVGSIYIQVGNRTFRQTVGIPMGTDCAPLLAKLKQDYHAVSPNI